MNYVEQTGTSAAASGTAYSVPLSGPGAGDYEVLYYAKITHVATGSTLGPVTIGWTDDDGSTPSCAFPPGGTGLTTNSLTTQINGVCFFKAAAGTNITYFVGYTSNPAATMQYELSVRVIALY